MGGPRRTIDGHSVWPALFEFPDVWKMLNLKCPVNGLSREADRARDAFDNKLTTELENKILSNVFQFHKECGHQKLVAYEKEVTLKKYKKMSAKNTESRMESVKRIAIQAGFVSKGMVLKYHHFGKGYAPCHYRIEKGVLYYRRPEAGEKSFSLPDTVTDTRSGVATHNVAVRLKQYDDGVVRIDEVQILGEGLDKIRWFKRNADKAFPLLEALKEYYGLNGPGFPGAVNKPGEAVATLTIDDKDRTIFPENGGHITESMIREMGQKFAKLPLDQKWKTR